MRNKKIIFFTYLSLLLASCNNSSLISSFSSSVEDSTSVSESITSESSKESTETSTNSTTSSETSSSESTGKTTTSESISTDSTTEPTPVFNEVDIGTVVNECKLLSMPVSQPHIATDINKKFTIKGHVIQNLTSGTTKSGYTPDGKTMLVDSTGWILCSSYSSSNTSLYSKVSSYVDKETTQYIVSGYIAFVFGTPELVVESFSFEPDLSISYESTLHDGETFTSLASYYEHTYNNVEYNIKGNGVGDIVRLNGLTCIGRADKASTGKWSFIDNNNHYLDVLYSANTNAFVPGEVYDLVGLQNIYHYNASFRVLRHYQNSEIGKSSIDVNNVVSTTINNLFNNISFKEDSYSKVSNAYFNNKMNIYSADVFVNHFEKSGKWYVTLSDNDYTPSAENDAYSHYQIPINNDDYWDTTERSFSYKNLYSYEDSSEKIRVYFALYQENHIKVDPIKNKAVWKVYLFEDLVPEFIEA